MKVVGFDLMSREVGDRGESLALDGHTDRSTDLIERASFAYELHDGVAGVLRALYEVLVSVGADLHGPCGIPHESVDVCTAVDLDDISQFEDRLIVDRRRVMGGNLVDTNITWERQLASVGSDVTLHFFGDIEELHTLPDHRHPELPCIGGDTACLAEFLQFLDLKHSEHPLSASL